MSNVNVDVVLGLQYGDEGKGKITHRLAKFGYDAVVRFNGGSNAGHTIYHNGTKFVTHLIPCGVFYDTLSVVGNGCVVELNNFFNEINYLKSNGIDTSLVKVAYNAHVVTDEQKAEDSQDTTIGTTRTGNGPCYRDKYARSGVRAEQISYLKPYLVDMEEIIYKNGSKSFLAEGAQAFGLDVDWGDYPYVTSSHCGIGAVLLNGFHHKQIRDVYGVIKAYTTYVGAKKFQPDEEVFGRVREVGGEYGATTGRPRQCDWLNLNLVEKAARMNGVNHILVNKMDILQQFEKEVGWNIYYGNGKYNFSTELDFKKFIVSTLPHIDIEFSYSPE
jgi:adenylosuccinate synthase